VGFLLRNLWLVVRTVVARPRRGGRDLPTEFTFELVCGWIRDHLSTELDGSTRGRLTELVYRRVTPGHGLTEVRPLARLPEQQLPTKCANRAAEKDAHARERLLHPHPTIPHHRLILQIIWTQEIENRIGNYLYACFRDRRR